MTMTRLQLIQALVRLGVREGDAIMLHASLRNIGRVIGGPDEVLLAVEDATGKTGTLLMYVGCQEGFDDVGRGCLTAEEEAFVLAHQPPFSFQHARAARNFGTLAEFFRTSPGTICSCHVAARMAARGARAEWLVADHPWTYGFGRGSPLDKLCQVGGKVLLLGSSHDEVTLLHFAEHITPFEDKRIAHYRVPLERNGVREWVDCEEFDWSGPGVHENWTNNAFALIVDDFLAKAAGTGNCRRGFVGSAASVLLDANTLVQHAMAIMRTWASEGQLRENDC